MNFLKQATNKLPQLPPEAELPIEIKQYCLMLKKAGFLGDLELNYSSRLVYATDNSIYQCLPQGIIFPKNIEDLALIGKVASSNTQFQSLTFSPRGGGTGTNGQSLTYGFIVDLNRYFSNIIEINIEQEWVRVESGVIKDQLNDALRPFGYFFSPDLSTSNRATIGGMINTDASGQGSLYYGKTSDHVLELTAVLIDGSIIQTQPISTETISTKTSTLAADSTADQFDLIKKCAHICINNRKLIEQIFPPLNRFLTGYDLKNSYNPEQHTFDLARILCGSEGTLAFIADAKLSITPLPKKRCLLTINYASFDGALRHAPRLVDAKALSVETIDSTVLNLAKADIIWHSVQPLLEPSNSKQPIDFAGINLVEFIADNEAELNTLVIPVIDDINKDIAKKSGAIISYQYCDQVVDIEKIYAMRKKAVGLLGATKGRAKPLPFTEDTCVPPEHLADYIAEFRTLLDSHKLHYGMFGHVDSGVLHVRPALNLSDPDQEALLHTLSDQVVVLVKKYGGLMWGEHGKGFRSQYVPDFFGPLYLNLQEIKSYFDPFNRLNPGKICIPFSEPAKEDASTTQLVRIDAQKRSYWDKQIPITVQDQFLGAMDCNGNGLCFNYDLHSTMCPSMKYFNDRRHSPKGRAALLREWLRLLTNTGVLLNLQTQFNNNQLVNQSYWIKLINQWRYRSTDDFSHQVMDVMQTCLACKACANQCPVSVDIPQLRTQFFHLYHSRYPRPFRDYLVGNIELLLPLLEKITSIHNFSVQVPFVQKLVRQTIGYSDLPLLSKPSLTDLTHVINHTNLIPFNLEELQSLSSNEKENYLIIVQDPFTSYYDAEVVSALIQLTLKLKKQVVLLPFKPNGKAQHVKGFLDQFYKTASQSAQFLNEIARLDIAMVGVEPSTVLCYRDEYNHILGEQRGDFKVLLAHEWLKDQHTYLEQLNLNITEQKVWTLFSHCTEKTKLPNCEKEWQQIFTQFNQKLEIISVGCCGMAGTFGHETKNLQASKGIFDLSWHKKLDQVNSETALATGYSCRSQVKRLAHIKMKHPVVALLEIID